MAVAQVLMAVGSSFFAMARPGTMYMVTLLIRLGYEAHWAIVPAADSELFGLKNFGALYNFLTVANPAGLLIFSGLITSSIYDYEAEKQCHKHRSPSTFLGRFGYGARAHMDKPLKCKGAICFFFSSSLMSGLCIFAVVLSLFLVHRTKIVYANLYGKSRR